MPCVRKLLISESSEAGVINSRAKAVWSLIIRNGRTFRERVIRLLVCVRTSFLKKSVCARKAKKPGYCIVYAAIIPMMVEDNIANFCSLAFYFGINHFNSVYVQLLS